MVVAVVPVVVMEVAARPVVDVAAVWDGGVAAAGAVLVALRVDPAFVAGLAFVGVARRDEHGVVVDVVAVLVVHVALMQVVLVAVVHDFVVAAAVGVVVVVRGMLFAGVHGQARAGLWSSHDKGGGLAAPKT